MNSNEMQTNYKNKIIRHNQKLYNYVQERQCESMRTNTPEEKNGSHEIK